MGHVLRESLDTFKEKYFTTYLERAQSWMNLQTELTNGHQHKNLVSHPGPPFNLRHHGEFSPCSVLQKKATTYHSVNGAVCGEFRASKNQNHYDGIKTHPRSRRRRTK